MRIERTATGDPGKIAAVKAAWAAPTMGASEYHQTTLLIAAPIESSHHRLRHTNNDHPDGQSLQDSGQREKLEAWRQRWRKEFRVESPPNQRRAIMRLIACHTEQFLLLVSVFNAVGQLKT